MWSAISSTCRMLSSTSWTKSSKVWLTNFTWNFFQSRNVDWKKFRVWISELFWTDPWKSWAGPGCTPNLVIFFRPQCGKEIPWAGHCFWKKSGCGWARKYPQNCCSSCKRGILGHFWDFPESPFYNYHGRKGGEGGGGYLSRITPIFFKLSRIWKILATLTSILLSLIDLRKSEVGEPGKRARSWCHKYLLMSLLLVSNDINHHGTWSRRKLTRHALWKYSLNHPSRG